MNNQRHADDQQLVVNQFARKDSPTLADVIESIKADSDLSKSKQTSLIKGIQTACRWFEKEPADVIAHPMNIRPRFVRLSPGGLGVSNKRIQNVRSSVKFALRYANIADGRSFKVPLTSDWQKLLDAVDNDYHKRKVRCILSFASARRVRSCDIDDDFSAALLQALYADRLHSDPRHVHQNAIRAWNRLVDSIDVWPRNKLTMPRYRKVKSPDAKPVPELQAAIERFLVRNSTDDPFDLDKPMIPWKPSTIAAYRGSLKRHFGLLVTLGCAPEELRKLSDLVQLNRAKAALKLFMEQNEGQGRVGASHLARLLSQIAFEAAKTEQDLTEDKKAELLAHAASLRELSDRLHRRNKVLGQRNRERLTPLRDERNLARLLLLPIAMADEMKRLDDPTRGEALLMQLVVALLILTFCPLRISSLCLLQIDRHLRWSSAGMTGELSVHFGWRELKSDEPEVFPLPAECARLIRKYVEVFRPKLAPCNSNFLFPGRFENKGKLRTVLSGQLQKLIFSRTGFDVNPHLYRHIVHLIVLRWFPGAYAMVSRVLAHRSLETAKKNYAYFDTELSMKAYHDLVRDVQAGQMASVPSSEVAYGIDREAMRDGHR